MAAIKESRPVNHTCETFIVGKQSFLQNKIIVYFTACINALRYTFLKNVAKGNTSFVLLWSTLEEKVRTKYFLWVMTTMERIIKTLEVVQTESNRADQNFFLANDLEVRFLWYQYIIHDYTWIHLEVVSHNNIWFAIPLVFLYFDTTL